jgi:hypothetical protein
MKKPTKVCAIPTRSINSASDNTQGKLLDAHFNRTPTDTTARLQLHNNLALVLVAVLGFLALAGFLCYLAVASLQVQTAGVPPSGSSTTALKGP